MKVKELKQGDHITQEVNNTKVSFEVLSIQQIGRRFNVTFRSILGVGSTCYQGNACVLIA
ncbi:hypothetical protein LIN78_05560 [Leeia sp. TBRC 13508]|uniref:Ribosomal protein L19 n=1 Tax=Leeia speluncae TaxID=2884804 RepID=A0ABS8D4U7_9NEIS|nr:hypothetical protein [Leeia speluncae]MCB6183013.1 hypothetical protein [Leeia speluncae]